MIVFDVSTLVGAATRRDGMPELALRRAFREDTVDVSDATMADVLGRPRLARYPGPILRADLVERLVAQGASYEPETAVADCRDAKDNNYLELALAAGAHTLVSSDSDLLVLHPWRGVRIARPADYLAEAGAAE